MKLEMHTMAVVSTANLSPETVASLEADDKITKSDDQILVYCGLDDAMHHGESLTECIDAIKAAHPVVSYILFDADAETVAELPKYDW